LLRCQSCSEISKKSGTGIALKISATSRTLSKAIMKKLLVYQEKVGLPIISGSNASGKA
jgi:hypothetical protein